MGSQPVSANGLLLLSSLLWWLGRAKRALSFFRQGHGHKEDPCTGALKASPTVAGGHSEKAHSMKPLSGGRCSRTKKGKYKQDSKFKGFTFTGKGLKRQKSVRGPGPFQTLQQNLDNRKAREEVPGYSTMIQRHSQKMQSAR